VIPSSADTTGQARYDQGGRSLMSLAMVTGLLSLITLGIYRFWGKTRIRKYFWGNTQIAGDAFEYTGTGLEKFLGFLVAVVVLAVYLAAVQLILFQFGLSFMFQPETDAEILMQVAVLYLSLFAVLPLLYFAQYRARRYKLARTRFRGIRFGMLGAAGGYVWRAILYTVVAILSLGLLTPLMTYRLEAYMTNRSWYGDARFAQGGKWTGLYGAMKHIIIGVVIFAVGAGLGGAIQSPALAIIGGIVGYFWGIFGFVHYRVQSFAYLTNHKTLGGEIGFQTTPRTGTVLGKVILGSIILSIVIGIVAGIGIFVLRGMFTGGNPQLAAIVGAVLYLALLVFAAALSLVLITEPIIAHVIGETRVLNMPAMAAIRQRVTDKGADAEGFADALDFGGAI
jgi:uncharacterized membrane protein YjgN (DUF898 family)